MQKEYGPLSSYFYQLSKPVGFSIDGDIDYYINALEGVSGRILEAGVGTGRMLIPLIKEGFLVDGIDSSPDMLAQCRANLKAHELEARLYEGDLRQLSLQAQYEAIIIPAGSLRLLPREGACKALLNFYLHLKPGGRLILDLDMPASFQAGKVTSRRLRIDEDRSLLLTSTSDRMDWLAQTTSYINRYDLMDQGTILKTELAHVSLTWYGVAEFEQLLSSMGYEDIAYEMGYGGQLEDLVTFRAHRPA